MLFVARDPRKCRQDSVALCGKLLVCVGASANGARSSAASVVIETLNPWVRARGSLSHNIGGTNGGHMQQVHLNDQLYLEAKHRAQEAGFASVDQFIADVLQHDFSAAPEILDNRFTPEVNAYLNRIVADMEAGRSLSLQDVQGNLDSARNAWRKNAGGAIP